MSSSSKTRSKKKDSPNAEAPINPPTGGHWVYETGSSGYFDGVEEPSTRVQYEKDEESGKTKLNVKTSGGGGGGYWSDFYNDECGCGWGWCAFWIIMGTILLFSLIALTYEPDNRRWDRDGVWDGRGDRDWDDDKKNNRGFWSHPVDWSCGKFDLEDRLERQSDKIQDLTRMVKRMARECGLPDPTNNNTDGR
jgi:hypothetical protein